MKNVLIYCISCNRDPYPMLIRAALETWDKPDVEGTETNFYCGGVPAIDHPKVLHFEVSDNYANMGRKNLVAFEWALENCDWDYMARINASCYVRKHKLIEHVQSFPEKGLFMGVGAPMDDTYYLWGGAQYLISRDVVQSIVEHKDQWDHRDMEDVAMSKLVRKLGFELNTKGHACGVNPCKDHWLCIWYAEGKQGGFEFNDMCEMKQAEDQYFIRVKQDLKRHIDVQIMKQLAACGV